MRHLLLVFAALGIAVPSLAQHPTAFLVSHISVGSHHMLTRYFLAAGRWSDANENIGPLSTEIHCYEALGFCEVASAEWNGSQAFSKLVSYDILRWDDKEIIAVDSSPACAMTTLRADLARKIVTIGSVEKGGTHGACERGMDIVGPATLLGRNEH